MPSMRGLFFLGALVFAVGCPSPPPKDTQYPPREPGCEVQVLPDTPPMPTDNIGPVSASCNDITSDADCMRELKDQACKLGADVVWGVSPNPTPQAGKKKFFGRAAHTKAAK